MEFMATLGVRGLIHLRRKNMQLSEFVILVRTRFELSFTGKMMAAASHDDGQQWHGQRGEPTRQGEGDNSCRCHAIIAARMSEGARPAHSG